MDADGFDRLLRRWATRRGSLHLAGGAAATGALSRFGAPAAVGGKGKKGKKKKKGCPAGKKACGKKCIPTGNCCKDTECDHDPKRGNEWCVNGRCGCLPGQVKHKGRCGTYPLCQSVGQICEADLDCCSSKCNVVADDGVTLRCNRGDNDCLTDADCIPGSTCRGYECLPA